MRRNIRVTLAYDGTDFFGWQIQARGRTVQGELERSLERMHKHRVQVFAAGRTDSGVHANGQVVNFFTDIDSIPAEEFHKALNSYLPPDIRALDSRHVEDRFHARYDARAREYRYRFWTRPVTDPMLRRYVWRLPRVPDIARLNRMAAVVVGSHDFSTFAVPRDASPSRVKDMYSAAFYPEPPYLVFRIAGRSFLWRMVRSLVGTMIELEARGADEDEMRRILEAKDRKLAGATAPACGLFLHRVIYDGDEHRNGRPTASE
jgi:tRNA pseudouridine38-40 synthase